MATPSEVLSDPNFHALPLGERLTVMRTLDPNFAGLSPKDQGTVIATAQQKVVGTTDAINKPQNAPDPGFFSTLGHDAASIPGALAGAVMHPLDTLGSLAGKQGEQFKQGRDAFKQGDYVSGVGHAMAGALPVLGPQAAQIGEELGGGQTGAGLAHAVELAGPKIAPPVMRAVSKGLKGAAVPVAESANGISYMDRANGRTPGQSILEETKGLRPETVARSARARSADLNTELEQAANQSTTPASLQPARDVIANRSRISGGGNSVSTPAELAEMQSQLTKPQQGFAGAVDPATGDIAVDQSPANILRMKREFGKDFTKWNPLNPKGEMGTARQAYRALDQELDRTVPGAGKLNQRISSLIPVAENAEKANLKAGIAQNVMHRAAAHTGALVGAAAGFHAGGPLGAAAGLVIPEVLSSPAVRMAAARGLYGAGKMAGSNAGQATAAGTAAAGAALRPEDDPLGLSDYLQ